MPTTFDAMDIRVVEPAPSEQPERDREEAQTVLNNYAIAKRVKEPFSKKWGLYWKLALSNHWPDAKQGDLERARPVIQKTHQAIETRLAHLTSRKPSIRIFPYAPGNDGAAALLQRVVDAVWDSAKLDELRSLAVRNTLVVGVGALKVLWDNNLSGGKGDVSVSVVDPHHLFISPGAISEEDCDFIIHAQNITMGQLRRMYYGNPDVLAKLPLISPGAREPALSIDVLADPAGEQYSAQAKGTDGVADNGLTYLGPVKRLSQGFAQDYEYVTVFEEWSRRSDGHIHVRVVANNVLLDSYPSPYQDEHYPFTFYRVFPSTITFWAPGLVSVVAGLQMTINRLYAQVLDILRLTGNPILLVPYESGIDVTSIRVKPGLVLGYNAGEGARPQWLTPGPLPGEVFASIQYFSRTIDEVLGNQEVLQGQNPPGVEAARAIEALASQAGVRIEREANWLEAGDKKLGRLLVSRVRQFYRDERVVLLVGEDGLVGPVTLNRAALSEHGSATIMNRISGDEVQIRVEMGQSLPAVRLAEFQKVLTLAQMGVFGPPMLPNGLINPVWQEEVLKAAMYPNYKQKMAQAEQVMMQSIEQRMAFAQAAAAASQGAPVSPGGEQAGASERAPAGVV